MKYWFSLIVFTLVITFSLEALSNQLEKAIESENKDYIQYVENKRRQKKKKEDSRQSYIDNYYKEQERKRKVQREFVENYYKKKSRMPASLNLDAEAEIEKERKTRSIAREKARQEYLDQRYKRRETKERVDRAYSSHPDIKIRDSEPWNE